MFSISWQSNIETGKYMKWLRANIIISGNCWLTLIDGLDSRRPLSSLFETPSAIFVPSPMINGILSVFGRLAISILSSDLRFLASWAPPTELPGVPGAPPAPTPPIIPDGVGARAEDAIDDREAGRLSGFVEPGPLPPPPPPESDGKGRFLPFLLVAKNFQFNLMEENFILSDVQSKRLGFMLSREKVR